MKDRTPNLNKTIAARVRALRAAHRLSLDALAEKSGVSRSMISLIERGESSPTAVVLQKLAVAFGVVLSALFDAPSETSDEHKRGPVARREDQTEWQDPDSGYRRRNVSPPDVPQPIQIVDVRFPPGARVAFENNGRDAHTCQQVWVLDGAMELTVGKERHRLNTGDCLAMNLDQPTMFHNPTRKPTRYAVVISTSAHTR
jgi:transcriptional regulator with XRE-family HTH domain